MFTDASSSRIVSVWTCSVHMLIESESGLTKVLTTHKISAFEHLTEAICVRSPTNKCKIKKRINFQHFLLPGWLVYRISQWLLWGTLMENEQLYAFSSRLIILFFTTYFLACFSICRLRETSLDLTTRTFEHLDNRCPATNAECNNLRSKKLTVQLYYCIYDPKLHSCLLRFPWWRSLE